MSHSIRSGTTFCVDRAAANQHWLHERRDRRLSVQRFDTHHGLLELGSCPQRINLLRSVVLTQIWLKEPEPKETQDEILQFPTPILLRRRSACQDPACVRRRLPGRKTSAQELPVPGRRFVPGSPPTLPRQSGCGLRVNLQPVLAGRPDAPREQRLCWKRRSMQSDEEMFEATVTIKQCQRQTVKDRQSATYGQRHCVIDAERLPNKGKTPATSA